MSIDEFLASGRCTVNYEHAYKQLRYAAEVFFKCYRSDGNALQALDAFSNLRAVLDAQAPRAEPSNKEFRSTQMTEAQVHCDAAVGNTATIIDADGKGRWTLATRLEPLEDDGGYAYQDRIDALQAELESVRRECASHLTHNLLQKTHIKDLQAELESVRSEIAAFRTLKNERDDYEARCLAELASVRRERDDYKHRCDVGRDGFERQVQLTIKALRELDDLDRAVAEISDARQDAEDALKSELESVRRERDEAQSNAHDMAKMAAETKAPRGQVFDPALVRELRKLARELLESMEGHTHERWLERLLVALSGSENRAAEPYGIAETGALLRCVLNMPHADSQTLLAAEAVRNSRKS